MRRTRTELKSWGALLIGGGLLLGLTLDAKSARADDGAARVVAREHFTRGVALARQRNYVEALREFQEAYAAVPHFSVLYNIGQAQVALGQSAEAVATLQRYLDEGGAGIDAKRRAEVEQTLTREREKTPQLAATVPAAATFEPTPAPEPPATLPATTLPTAKAPGVEPALRSNSQVAPSADEPPVDVIGSVKPARSAKPPEPRAGRRPPKLAHVEHPRAKKASRASQRTFAYVVGGTGLALAGGAVAHYLWNRGRYEEWQSKYATYFRDPTEPNRREANALSDSIDRASAVTVVLAVGAGVAFGTSSLLWVTSGPASSDKHAGGFEPFFNVKGTF